MQSIPIFNNENTEFYNVFKQLIYIINENESIFYIRSIENPSENNKKIDKLLLAAAILKKSGYITDGSIDNSNSDSIVYYKNQKEYVLRNHDVFKARWHKDQSNYWNYLVL